jgi:hypothetical protein
MKPVKYRHLIAIAALAMAMLTGNARAEGCPDGLQIQQWLQQGRALLSHREALIKREKTRIYIAGPHGGGPAMHQELQRRVAAIDAKINADKARYPRLFLDQEIKNFPLTGGADCLVWAMQLASGQDLKYTPYSDGKFDLTLGTKKIRSRISGAELLSIAKSLR